jgi:hypothetical protein
MTEKAERDETYMKCRCCASRCLFRVEEAMNTYACRLCLSRGRTQPIPWMEWESNGE